MTDDFPKFSCQLFYRSPVIVSNDQIFIDTIVRIKKDFCYIIKSAIEIPQKFYFKWTVAMGYLLPVTYPLPVTWKN